MKDNIFDFAGLFDVVSPFNDWVTENKNQRLAKESDLNTIRITEVDGPSLIYEGGIFEYKVTSFNKSDFSVSTIAPKIKWSYSIDNGPIKRISGTVNRVTNGKIEVFTKIRFTNLKGSQIRIYGWLKKPIKSVSVVSSILTFPFYFDRYKLKGLNRTLTGLADDLAYGDGVTVTNHFRYTQKDVEDLGALMRSTTMTFPNSQLWSNLKSMVGDLFSTGELEKVALKMVDKFKSNTGGEFQNAVLTKHVSKHSTTVSFCKKIEEGIQEKLKQSKGNIAALSDSTVYLNSERYGRPQFSSLKDTFFGGLTICINDTWAYEVFITDFNTTDGINYSIGYKVNIFDHFGLDYPDLQVTSYYSLAGFRAWFVLQHLRNFKPFITKIELNKSFKGNIHVGEKEINDGKRARAKELQELRDITRRKPWEY